MLRERQKLAQSRRQVVECLGGIDFLFPSMSLPLFIHPLLPVFRFRALHDTPMPAVKDETTGTRLLRTCGVIKVPKYKVLGHSSIWESPDHG